MGAATATALACVVKRFRCVPVLVGHLQRLLGVPTWRASFSVCFIEAVEAAIAV